MSQQFWYGGIAALGLVGALQLVGIHPGGSVAGNAVVTIIGFWALAKAASKRE